MVISVVTTTGTSFIIDAIHPPRIFEGGSLGIISSERVYHYSPRHWLSYEYARQAPDEDLDD